MTRSKALYTGWNSQKTQELATFYSFLNRGTGELQTRGITETQCKERLEPQALSPLETQSGRLSPETGGLSSPEGNIKGL